MVLKPCRTLHGGPPFFRFLISPEYEENFYAMKRLFLQNGYSSEDFNNLDVTTRKVECEYLIESIKKENDEIKKQQEAARNGASSSGNQNMGKSVDNMGIDDMNHVRDLLSKQSGGLGSGNPFSKIG